MAVVTRWRLELDELTTDEIEEFEEASGVGFRSLNLALSSGEKPMAKAWKHLMVLAARREGETLTLDEAGKLPWTSLTLKKSEDDEDPSGPVTAATE